MIPGARVYWHCANQKKRNPLWDQYFFNFEKNWTSKIIVSRQKEQKENFSFFLKNKLFIGVNLFEKRDREKISFNKIMENNISWIKESIRSHQDRIQSLVIFAHDFSGLRDKNSTYEVCGNISLKYWDVKKHYKYFDDQFIQIAKEFKKPILYVHDNSECWTYDRPYKEVPNVERIMVEKVRNAPFVQVTLDDSGFHIDQKKNKRINFFIKEANLGNIWAQYFLGLEYFKLKDYKNAKKWLIKGANKKFAPAQVELGKVLLEDKNIINDNKYLEIFNLFQSAIQSKSLKDINLEFRKNRNITNTSYFNKISQFRDKIIKDSVFLAHFYLGYMFENGFGVPQNYQKALENYKKASKGIGQASYNIAVMYFNGSGLKKDFIKAKDWCVKGDATGVVKCSAMLGYLYYMGQGVEKDYKKASKYFNRSINHHPSLLILSSLYFWGFGVNKDPNAAMYYLNKAAKLGNLEANRIINSGRQTNEKIESPK